MSLHPLRRAAPIVLALLGAGLVAVLCFRFVVLRSDLADFLPQGGTPAARLMLDQLRSGPATSLVLIGIENAPAAELARISRAMQATMAASGRFASVTGGEAALDGPDEQFLMAHRYLLSPVTTSEAFTAPALRADFQRLLAGLASSAAPLVSEFGLADPPGALLELARVWTGGSRLRTVDGVWFAPERDRALILCRTRANGLDLAEQDDAGAAIATAFQAADPKAARLLVSGPAVFARQAAEAIRSDVRLLSIVSTLLVAALLIWRFRSPLVLAVIAVPLLLGVSLAALAVQLIFGFVQGIAFAFGMVMLGVTVDYPVLLVGHRKRGEAAPGTLRRIGAAFDLAVTTAALGLTGMIFSGFPGIVQLGTFSAIGGTRCRCRDPLRPAAAHRGGRSRARLRRRPGPTAPRRTVAAPARLGPAARWRCATYLAWIGGPRFETDLANLSPVPVQRPGAGRGVALRARRPRARPGDRGAGGERRGGAATRGGAASYARPAAGRARDCRRRDRGTAAAERRDPVSPAAPPCRTGRHSPPPSTRARAGLPFRPEAFRRFADDVAATQEHAASHPRCGIDAAFRRTAAAADRARFGWLVRAGRAARDRRYRPLRVGFRRQSGGHLCRPA